MRSKGILAGVAAAFVAALTFLVSVSGSAAADTNFGLDPVVEVALGGSSVIGVRVGQSEGFDRMTIEFEGAVPGYAISYVPQILQDGVGEPVPVEGVAFIQVVLTGVPEEPTAPQGTVTPGLPGISQVVGAGAGVDETAHYGIGTIEAAGFRILIVSNPNRLIVDVAHPGTLPGTTTAADPSATGDIVPTTTAPELTLTGDALAQEPESPNEWLIYPVGGLAFVAIVAAVLGWTRRRRR